MFLYWKALVQCNNLCINYNLGYNGARSFLSLGDILTNNVIGAQTKSSSVNDRFGVKFTPLRYRY